MNSVTVESKANEFMTIQGLNAAKWASLESLDPLRALTAKEPVAQVLHMHGSVETLLNNFLQLFVRCPEHLKPMQLDYFGKVHLALALGLPAELKNPLLKLGKLRNSFAHEPEQVLDKSNMKSFFESFPAETRVDIVAQWRKIATVSGLENRASWRDAWPIEQFAVLGMKLTTMLYVAGQRFAGDIQVQRLQLDAYQELCSSLRGRVRQER